MTILAGEIVPAGRLERLKTQTYYASCTSDSVGSVTNADIAGTTIVLDTLADNAIYVATAAIDFDAQSGGTTTAAIAGLMVDGVTQSAQAVFQAGAATSNDRSTVCQIWRGTLATAGSHTIKLRAISLPAGMEINATHTNLLIEIHEVV